MHSFKPTWLCLIVKVHSTRVESFQPSLYCTVVNCAFSFCTAVVFGRFDGVIAQFEVVRQKFPNLSTLNIHLCSFQITHGVNQCTKCQRSPTTILPTTASTIMARTASVTWYTHRKIACSKMLQNSWFTQESLFQ